MLKRLLVAACLLFAVIAGGTGTYWVLGQGKSSLLDCLYMTFITVTTIGYGEVIDLGSQPWGRAFTMVLATSGIGLMTYILVSVTAFVLEGELNENFRRRKMEKKVAALENHYVVCGIEGVGHYIQQELRATGRPHVLVLREGELAAGPIEDSGGLLYIEGDATDGDTLRRAGVLRAKGLFAVSGDDNRNLVVSLTARQLNPRLKIVARCENVKNEAKLKAAGADSVISPASIGGLRMASEMLRPSVVSFLDIMLRQDDINLRIEEVAVPPSFAKTRLADLNLARFGHSLLLAMRTGGQWRFNPPQEQEVGGGDILIFMSSPEGRKELEQAFLGGE